MNHVTGGAEFASFLEVVPDAIVGIGHDGSILFVNSLAASLFGRERGELIGEPIELLLPRSFREAVSLDPNLDAPRTPLQMTGRRNDGSEFPVEISWMSTQPGGDPM